MRARVCMDLGASVFHIKNFHQYSEQLQYHLPSSSSSNASSSSIDSDTHEGNLRLTVCPSFILVRVCVGQNNESNASASKSDVASFFPFVLMQMLEACPSTPRRRLGQRSRPWVLSWVLHWPLAQTFFVQPFATQIPFRTVPEGASVKFRVSKINIIYAKCNIRLLHGVYTLNIVKELINASQIQCRCYHQGGGCMRMLFRCGHRTNGCAGMGCRRWK